MANYRRSTYFIEKRFQANFILKFCAVVAAGGLLTIGILYVLALRSTTVSIVDSRVAVKSTADFLLPVLIQTVVVVVVLTSAAAIAVTLFVSHRIAGPLYRLKKKLKELEEGDLSGDFRIRHLDQLQDVAESFNEMLKRIRQECTQVKGKISELKEKVDGISEQDVTEQRRSVFVELKNISSELKRLIHYFKT